MEPLPSEVYPDPIKKFMTRLDITMSPLIKDMFSPIADRLNKIRGFIKNTDGTQDLINSRIGKQIGDDAKIKMVSHRLEALADELGLSPVPSESAQ